MKTAITELFGIKYPIMNAGMGRVALPKMVAAVSNAGGLGVYGAGSNAPEITRAAIREIRKLTDKPFAGNAPLALPNGRANAEVMLEEKVPVINYSMGKGDWIVKRAHEYGGKVMASINSVHLARRAELQGVDAIVATGHEAAGHSGDVTTFVLIPRLAEILKVPIIAAGGVGNGAGLLAALALGASGVWMGTRFLATQESPTHQNFKNKAVELDIDGTLYSTRFDGMPCRMMKTPGAERAMTTMVNPMSVFVNSFAIARELNIPYLKLLVQILAKGPTATINMMRMARQLKAHETTLTSGDMQTGVTGSGMTVGLVHDVPTVAVLVERIMAEAYAAQAKLSASMAG